MLPAGKLPPLTIPQKKWASMSMDLIVQLPKTKRGLDAIKVCVDRLTQMCHAIPTTRNVNADMAAKLFRDHVHVCEIHGMPLDIVSDRDSFLTGEFTRAPCSLLGIKQNLTTAYRPGVGPQSDERTDCMHRVFEAFEDTLMHL